AQEETEAALEEAQAELTSLRDSAETSEDDLRAQLAAALAAKARAEREASASLREAEERAALLSTAERELSDAEELAADSRREVESLRQLVETLRSDISTLQSLLDVAAEEDAAAEVQIQALGQQLNAALARAA
ncbi:peptidoglycan-binding protein, partial [Psychromarinibacter sp. C21-152]|nr:peptidoglycan-binding protein [Psychromarinibacter sediminicola]